MKKLNHLTVQYIQLLQQINSLHAQKKNLRAGNQAGIRQNIRADAGRQNH